MLLGRCLCLSACVINGFAIFTRMARAAGSIDLAEEIDLIYLYRNASIFHELLTPLSLVHIYDINTALICFGILESAIFSELGLETVDPELEYCMDSSQSSENRPKTEQNQFYIENMEALLSPLLSICSKQAVDLVLFVYQKTSTNYFELLFRSFANEADLLVELHLLMARLLRTKPFDLSAFKEFVSVSASDARVDDVCSNEIVEFEKETKSVEKDLALINNDLTETKSGGWPGAIEEDGFVSQKDDDGENNKLNLYSKVIDGSSRASMTYLQHLDSSIRLLAGIDSPNQTFIIENLSTLLSMKYYEDVWRNLLCRIGQPYFYSCMCKFDSAPFILFSGSEIRSILSGRIRKREREARWKDAYCGVHTRCGTLVSVASLYKHTWCNNPMNLKNFIEFIIETFNDERIPLQQYILISKNLDIITSLTGRKTAGLVKWMLTQPVHKARDILAEGLIENLESIMEEYYEEWDEEYNEDKIYDEWRVKLIPEKVIPETISKREIRAAMEEIRDVLEDLEAQQKNATKFEKTLNLIKKPEIYSEYEKKAFESLNESLMLLDCNGESIKMFNEEEIKGKKKVSLVEDIETFLIKSSENKLLKEGLLRKLHVLERIKPKVREEICRNLVEVDGMAWRYRKELVLNSKQLMAWCEVSRVNLNRLLKDKVWLVRKLAKLHNV